MREESTVCKSCGSPDGDYEAGLCKNCALNPPMTVGELKSIFAEIETEQ